MKCPKCGYNSFEIHDTCKKCACDLTGYKDSHGLKSIVLPHETRTSMAEKMRAGKTQDVPAAAAEAPADMFSFDVPESETTENADSFLKDDPFDFGDEPVSTLLGEDAYPFGNSMVPEQDEGEEDTFSDLDFLESPSRHKGGTPSAPQPSGAPDRTGPDPVDLSWDDMPGIAPGETTKPAEDDFGSLFGDTDETAHK